MPYIVGQIASSRLRRMLASISAEDRQHLFEDETDLEYFASVLRLLASFGVGQTVRVIA